MPEDRFVLVTDKGIDQCIGRDWSFNSARIYIYISMRVRLMGVTRAHRPIDTWRTGVCA